MLIAQISDLHVMRAGALAHGRFDTAATLARCVAHLRTLRRPPDVVLATGDLCDNGEPEEYERLRALLAPLAMPLYLIPGNHDRRAALQSAFPGHGYLPPRGAPFHYVVDDHDVRLIALDTLVEGEDGGTLDAEQVRWLDGVLAAAPQKPALVFMHHPPVASGMRRIDGIALDAGSTARLADVVRRHPQIRRIVCGHVHRGLQAHWMGTLVSVCPSTAYQIDLDLAAGEFSPSHTEPPAYQMHDARASGFVTHTVSVNA